MKHAGRAVPLDGTEIPPHPPRTSTGPETSPVHGVECWVLHPPAEQEQAQGPVPAAPGLGGRGGAGLLRCFPWKQSIFVVQHTEK